MKKLQKPAQEMTFSLFGEGKEWFLLWHIFTLPSTSHLLRGFEPFEVFRNWSVLLRRLQIWKTTNSNISVVKFIGSRR